MENNKNIEMDKSFKKRLISRKIKDLGINGSTLLFSLFTIAILIWMVVYIFSNGGKYLTLDFIKGDYSQSTITIKTKDDFELPLKTFEDNNKEETESSLDIGFSSKWGVKLIDGVNAEEKVVYFSYIASDSPFNDLIDYRNNKVNINVEFYITTLTLIDKNNEMIITTSKDGAKKMCEALDNSISILDGTMVSNGKGIRGSLLTTLSLIGFSLLFSLPLGIGAAIYLGVYSKDNKFSKIIRTLIDVTSGIPSIIFGLAGAIIFIPFTNSFLSSSGGNMFSGALTLAIMLLPTIVKTVEESIKVIPISLSNASLSLGASKTQTVFKIILPNAIGGILTSTLLSIGRIIGESAALVFSMGAILSDNVSLTQGNATLAVHIWAILQGETPQYGNACAISIIILLIVLFLSILVKLISIKLNKFKGGK